MIVVAAALRLLVVFRKIREGQTNFRQMPQAATIACNLESVLMRIRLEFVVLRHPVLSLVSVRLTPTMTGRLPAATPPAGGPVHREVRAPYSLNHVGTSSTTRAKLKRLAATTFHRTVRVRGTPHHRMATQYSMQIFRTMMIIAIRPIAPGM